MVGVGIDMAQPLLLGISWMSPDWLLATFGQPLYWVTLGIIFVECGLFFPFLPGDTLLLALGVFIAGGKIDLWPGPPSVEIVIAMAFFTVAAVAGNITGYEIGRKIGPALYNRDGRFIKRKHLDETQAFFDKHGPKALIIGRFVPFVRTYVTVVAGITRLDRRRFYIWSVVGALLWVLAITLTGYFVGARFPWLAENIDYVIFGLLFVTAVPVVIGWLRSRRHEDEGGPQDVDDRPRDVVKH